MEAKVPSLLTGHDTVTKGSGTQKLMVYKGKGVTTKSRALDCSFRCLLVIVDQRLMSLRVSLTDFIIPANKRECYTSDFHLVRVGMVPFPRS